MVQKLSISILFLLFVQTSFSQNGFLEEYKEKRKNGMAYTLKVLDAMPDEDLAYRPQEDMLSFTQLYIHIIDNIVSLSGNYITGNDVSKIRKKLQKNSWTRGDLRTIFVMMNDYFIEVLDNLEPADLAREVDFFAGKKTVRQVLRVIDDHHTHHRAQMITYLRLKGIKPPSYTGW